MGYVYRYTDLADNIIKYVGIVWSDNRTLKQRLIEHENGDEWCKVRRWKIEYIHIDINTRTDAEYFESHYISLYETDKYFNIKKAGWGTSSFLPDRELEWKEYNNDDTANSLFIEETLLRKDIEQSKEKISQLQDEIIKLAIKRDSIIDAIELKNNYIVFGYSKEQLTVITEIIEFIEDYIHYAESFVNKDNWKHITLGCKRIREKLLKKYLNIECFDYNTDISILNYKTKLKYSPKYPAIDYDKLSIYSKMQPCKIQYYYNGEYQGEDYFESVKCASDTIGIASYNIKKCIDDNYDKKILYMCSSGYEIQEKMSNINYMISEKQNFYIIEGISREELIKRKAG